MDLHQLRCFVAVAEDLHFGHAAHRLEMLPSALGRHVRLLEEDLDTRLMVRTTRSVTLTDEGAALLREARLLLTHADDIAARFRSQARSQTSALRIGAIDSAAAGLLPMLLHDFRERQPDTSVNLTEDKSIRLLPRLLSGRIDLAFIRLPENPDKRLESQFLFHETAVVALSDRHPLAHRKQLSVEDLANEPLIVPERRSRPHSHDLTIKLFNEAGLDARIAQIADEKQTIVNLVAAELGIAIVPRWTSRIAPKGVRFVALKAHDKAEMKKLPLAAVWLANSRDRVRDNMIETLRTNLKKYADKA